jgi:hypothetical protein
MLDAPAYRVLSQAAHRVLARIEIELCRHGGKDNGELPVTTDNFVEYGIHRHAVSPAIRELEDLGFIQVIRGLAAKAGQRRPSLYRLTYLPSSGDEEPTNEWAAVLTIEAAEEIARQARSRKAAEKVGFRWQNPSSENQNIRCRKTPNSDVENHHRETSISDAGIRHQHQKNPDAGIRHLYLDIYPSSTPTNPTLPQPRQPKRGFR